jgi:hypothetical protein
VKHRRHTPPPGLAFGEPDDGLREAIHGATRKNGLLRRFAPRNDEKHIEDGVTDSNFKQQL